MSLSISTYDVELARLVAAAAVAAVAAVDDIEPRSVALPLDRSLASIRVGIINAAVDVRRMVIDANVDTMRAV